MENYKNFKRLGSGAQAVFSFQNCARYAGARSNSCDFQFRGRHGRHFFNFAGVTGATFLSKFANSRPKFRIFGVITQIFSLVGKFSAKSLNFLSKFTDFWPKFYPFYLSFSQNPRAPRAPVFLLRAPRAPRAPKTAYDPESKYIFSYQDQRRLQREG